MGEVFVCVLSGQRARRWEKLPLCSFWEVKSESDRSNQPA